MATKADLINDAYSQLRISGLTVQASPADITVALRRLEGMAAEWESRDMCIGYVFEDAPDINTESGVQSWAQYAVSANLAVRLVPDFNKAIPQLLMMQATQSASNVASRTAVVNQINYPSRQPRGSRNTLRTQSLQRYYPPTVPVPTGCDVKRMIVGDTDDFTESWATYLENGEDVASFTISADAGLTIVSSSLSTPSVNYRINAVGVNPERPILLPQVTIVVTTTDGRIDTRIIQFELTQP